MYIAVFYDHIKVLAEEKKCSIPEALRFAESLGIEAVDVCYDDVRENPEEFRKMLEECGMKTASVYGAVKMHTMEDLPEGKEYIDIVHRVGSPNAMALPAEIPYGVTRTEILKTMTPALDALGEYAAAKGITLTLENISFIKRPFSLISDFHYILSNSKNIRYTLDTGNYAIHFEDALEALRAFKDKTAHVHLKSWDFPERWADDPDKTVIMLEGRKYYAYPTMDGGIVDLDPIMRELKEMNYSGALTMEIFDVDCMEEALKQSIAYIRRFF